jgi:hypothetical protein
MWCEDTEGVKAGLKNGGSQTYVHITYSLSHLLTHKTGVVSHTHTHTYVHTHVRTHTHTYTHTYVHTHIRTHTHTYTHIRTHTHTYTHTSYTKHAHTGCARRFCARLRGAAPAGGTRGGRPGRSAPGRCWCVCVRGGVGEVMLCVKGGVMLCLLDRKWEWSEWSGEIGVCGGSTPGLLWYVCWLVGWLTDWCKSNARTHPLATMIHTSESSVGMAAWVRVHVHG